MPGLSPDKREVGNLPRARRDRGVAPAITPSGRCRCPAVQPRHIPASRIGKWGRSCSPV